MLLEVTDFPPLFGLVDAHALWHATTPPFVFVWYRMFAADAAWLAQKRPTGKKRPSD